MKKLLLSLLALLLLAMPVFGQDLPFASQHSCESGFIIQLPQDARYLITWVDAGSNVNWYTEDEGFRKVYDFETGQELVFSISFMDGREEVYYYTVPDCSSEPEPELVYGKECLGVSYEGSGIFVVDGIDYAFDNALSFVVPFDTIWRWELFIEGELILVFEQTERGNCRIVEDYRG